MHKFRQLSLSPIIPRGLNLDLSLKRKLRRTEKVETADQEMCNFRNTGQVGFYNCLNMLQLTKFGHLGITVFLSERNHGDDIRDPGLKCRHQENFVKKIPGS